MLLGREGVHVLLGVEVPLAGLGRPQVLHHRLAVDALLEPEVDDGVVAGVEQVVRLVLRVVHAERLLDVVDERVHLEREVLASHGVEEVEADRELGAEARVRPLAQQRPRLREHQVQRRDLQERAVGVLEQQRVLLGDAVEAPGVVRRPVGQVEPLLHPLPAPHAGVEERHHAQRRVRGVLQGRAEGVAGDHARLVPGRRRGPGGAGVEHEVEPVEQGALVAVGHAPFDEEAALVLAQAVLVGVRAAPVRRPGPLARLDLPARHVGQHERVGRGGLAGGEVGAPADEHGGAALSVDVGGDGGEALGVVEGVEGGVRHHAEHPVVGEVGGDEGVDLARGARGGLLDVDDPPLRQRLGDRPGDQGEVRAGVGVDDEQRRAPLGPVGGRLGGPDPRVRAGEHAGVGRQRHGRPLLVASDRVGGGRTSGGHERSFVSGSRPRARRVRAAPRGRVGRGRRAWPRSRRSRCTVPSLVRLLVRDRAAGAAGVERRRVRVGGLRLVTLPTIAPK